MKRRRGITMVIAMMTLAIAAVAVLTTSQHGTLEARAVGRRIAADQLDQLLLAAMLDTPKHLNQSAPAVGQSWQLSLPRELSDATVHVHIIETQSEVVTLSAEASCAGATATQTLRFARSPQWKCLEARLE